MWRMMTCHAHQEGKNCLIGANILQLEVLNNSESSQLLVHNKTNWLGVFLGWKVSRGRSTNWSLATLIYLTSFFLHFLLVNDVLIPVYNILLLHFMDSSKMPMIVNTLQLLFCVLQWSKRHRTFSGMPDLIVLWSLINIYTCGLCGSWSDCLKI